MADSANLLSDLYDLSDNDDAVHTLAMEEDADDDDIGRFLDIMERVQRAHTSGFLDDDSDDDPEYERIVYCNALLSEIDYEISIIHNFVLDKYRLKFPELESLVVHPVDYARVVKKIGNESDLSRVDLDGLLPSAGGLTELAKMPSCNLQLLGAKRNNLAGFSKFRFREGGYIEQTDIFQSTPPSLRMHVCRKLAAKSTLAVRVDLTGGDPTGKAGRLLREEICKRIDKWQELPPAKQPKALPVPDCESKGKKKRGGRRQRKRKERYAMTDTRKLANRMPFGVPEETSLGDGLGEGYGMLGLGQATRNLNFYKKRR